MALARGGGAVDASGRVRFSRLGETSVHYILKKPQEEAGLEGITPHAFSRRFVGSLLEAGVDVFTVPELAGHADAVSTARYDRRGRTSGRPRLGICSFQ